MQKERCDKLSRSLREARKRLDETVVKSDIRRVLAAISEVKATVSGTKKGETDTEV